VKLGEETGERCATDMEMWTEVRRKVLVDGFWKRRIKRDYGIRAETLDKILRHSELLGLSRDCLPPQASAWPVLRGDRRDLGIGQDRATNGTPHGRADL
jgi:hypothetical protein